MKQHLLLFALLFAAVVAKAQTVVVLELPDPCPTQVEETLMQNSGLTVAPNPVDDALTLQFDDTECPNAIDVTISDARGGVVLKERHTVSSSPSVKLSLGHLPAGLYFLNVRTEKSTFVHKIIKN